MKLRTVVIILHHSGVANTMECLRSLETQDHRDFLTVLILNGNADPINDFEIRSFSDLCYIRIPENSGFTGGVNAGIRYALSMNAEYIWLVNNDTIIPPTCLSSLIKAAENHSDYAIFTPLIYQYPSKEVWFAGSTFDEKRFFAFHSREVPETHMEDITDIPWATGCAMLLRRSALGYSAPFDERFFLKWEDVDVSLRLKSAGWGIGLVWDSTIYHKVSQSCPEESPFSVYFDTRNHLLFAVKRTTDRLRVECGIIAYHLHSALHRFRHGTPFTRSVLPCIWGVQDHIVERYGRGRWVR